MSDTHQWNVSITGTNVIGDIIEANSIFYTGPFAPSTFALLAEMELKNIGDKTGFVQWALYEHPDTADETFLRGSVELLAPGQTALVQINHTTPNNVTQWPLGIKVWGETESEPGWQLGASLEISPFIPAAIAISGIFLVLYLASRR